MSWMEIAHPEFQRAVNHIWDSPMLDGHTSYTAHRIRIGIQKVDKEIQNRRIVLIDKYAKKGEDGKAITDGRGFVTFEKPEDNEAFEAEFQKEFGERYMELKVSKLDFQKLIQARGLTPKMWEYLEPIVDNLPTEIESSESATQQAP